MATVGVYTVCEKDGTEIFRGTMDDLVEKFNVKARTVSRLICRKTLMNRKYAVKRVGYVATTRIKKTDEQMYEYLKTHLLIYGNTGCTFDPVPYLPRLLDDGLNCRVREVNLSNKGGVTKRHRKKEPYYVLEVAR